MGRHNFILITIIGSVIAGLVSLTPSYSVENFIHIAKEDIQFCPPVYKLKKNKDMTWSGPGKWASYETSFALQLDRFLGAQWTGANVGQITCVYESRVKTDFPVLLTSGRLIYDPRIKENLHLFRYYRWQVGKPSITNCASDRPLDCPFIIQTKEDTEDLYKSLEKAKDQPSSDQSNN